MEYFTGGTGWHLGSRATRVPELPRVAWGGTGWQKNIILHLDQKKSEKNRKKYQNIRG